MTKRNRWHKKQLRIVSRSYRVCQTVYVSKERREKTRVWSLKYARAIWDADILEIEKGHQISLYEILTAYAQGKTISRTEGEH